MEKINIKDLKQNLETGKTVVYVSASWCGECKMNHSLVESISTHHEGVKFIEIDADENKLWKSNEESEVFSVHKVPTFLVFQDGDEILREEGFKNTRELEKILAYE
jgi:thiol-disulfide isomerase/thioredoxin